MPTAYCTDIEAEKSEINQYIHDFLVPRISGHWLDIGCNTGWLLSLVPNGLGVERSLPIAERAREKGRLIFCCDAVDLPFHDGHFDLAVLANVLEQCEDWRKVYAEAKRVAQKVIGVNPLPGSEWGKTGGWVKAVIDPKEFPYSEMMLYDKYFFSSEREM